MDKKMQFDSVGMQIRLARVAHGWTLYDLEDASGVASSKISDIENGNGNPTLATLHKICNALHLSIELLHRDQRLKSERDSH